MGFVVAAGAVVFLSGSSDSELDSSSHATSSSVSIVDAVMCQFGGLVLTGALETNRVTYL